MRCLIKHYEKILCTRNLDNHTIAWAVLQKWLESCTISRSRGVDLRLKNSSDSWKFIDIGLQHTVFINSSYVEAGFQTKLANVVVSEWTRADIKGHIINIGATAEWDQSLAFTDYIKSKIDLRNLSLEYNQQTGITGVKSTYLILGGINNGQLENRDYLDPMSIVEVVDWVLKFPDRIALVHVDRCK